MTYIEKVDRLNAIVRELNELNIEQDELGSVTLDMDLRDALWQIAKDPDLRPQLEGWKSRARQKRDKALARIRAGENVPEPERI